MKRTVLSIVMMWVMAVCVQADVIVTADQDNSITPGSLWDSTADSFEVRGKAGANFSRKAYIHFDLSGLTYDAEQSATFTVACLESTAYAGKIFVRALNAGFSPEVGVLDTDWTETGISWDNAPGNNVSSPYGFSSSDTTAIGDLQMTAGSVTNGLVLEFTIDRIGDFIQSDGSVTIMMSSYDAAVGNICNIASSENSLYDGPMLTVVPEPASLSMVLLGTVSLMLVRKIRS